MVSKKCDYCKRKLSDSNLVNSGKKNMCGTFACMDIQKAKIEVLKIENKELVIKNVGIIQMIEKKKTHKQEELLDKIQEEIYGECL